MVLDTVSFECTSNSQWPPPIHIHSLQPSKNVISYVYPFSDDKKAIMIQLDRIKIIICDGALFNNAKPDDISSFRENIELLIIMNGNLSTSLALRNSFRPRYTVTNIPHHDQTYSNLIYAQSGKKLGFILKNPDLLQLKQ